MALCEPAAHKFALGTLKLGTPAAVPHAPLTAGAGSKVALTVQSAVTAPVVKLLTPATVAVPEHPLMLTVRYPLAGDAAHVVEAFAVTKVEGAPGEPQSNAPLAPAFVVTT